ncbi:MAG: PEP-CTERM sorting domain-containing protein [Bryobacteraceae bacterium]
MGFLKNIFSARALLLAGALAVLSVTAQGGRIVVNHDEWATSNAGYAHSGESSAHQFVVNLGNFLAGPGGNILVYSGNFGLNESSFRSSLASGGFTVTYGDGSYDLSLFDAIFLSEALPPGNEAFLSAFVNGGGGVYIQAGTGFPGPEGEAGRWNGFLMPFGLQFDPLYNNCCGNDPVDNPQHALFNGVTQLYYNNGNSVKTVGSNPYVSLIEHSATGRGLIGVFDSSLVATPEPSTYFLVSVGLLAAWWKRRSVATL